MLKFTKQTNEYLTSDYFKKSFNKSKEKELHFSLKWTSNDTYKFEHKNLEYIGLRDLSGNDRIYSRYPYKNEDEYGRVKREDSYDLKNICSRYRTIYKSYTIYFSRSNN